MIIPNKIYLYFIIFIIIFSSVLSIYIYLNYNLESHKKILFIWFVIILELNLIHLYIIINFYEKNKNKKGIQGPKGEKGCQGERGCDGARGPKGHCGNDGCDGKNICGNLAFNGCATYVLHGHHMDVLDKKGRQKDKIKLPHHYVYEGITAVNGDIWFTARKEIGHGKCSEECYLFIYRTECGKLEDPKKLH